MANHGSCSRAELWKGFASADLGPTGLRSWPGRHPTVAPAPTGQFRNQPSPPPSAKLGLPALGACSRGLTVTRRPSDFGPLK